MGYVRHVTMTDDQLSYIEEFCAKIRTGLDNADFNAKRQIIQLLDIRGKIAFENGERVLYLKCLIELREPQAVSRSLNVDWQNSVELTVRLVLGQGISLAEVLFSGKSKTNQIA